MSKHVSVNLYTTVVRAKLIERNGNGYYTVKCTSKNNKQVEENSMFTVSGNFIFQFHKMESLRSGVRVPIFIGHDWPRIF